MSQARWVARFSVRTTPVQQGSKTPKLIPAPGTKHGVRAILYDDNSKPLKAWRAAVTSTAMGQVDHSGRPVRVLGPVAIRLTFTFERPKSVKREWPAVRPDLDKLVRAVLDGITDSKLWHDDAQVVDMRVTKQYGPTPGVEVVVGEYEEEQ